MTFSDYLALASALVALSAVVVALRYRQLAVDAQAVVAAMGALPDGMVCRSEPETFTKHWYDGAEHCRRCDAKNPRYKAPEGVLTRAEAMAQPGMQNPYAPSALAEALAVAARAEEQS